MEKLFLISSILLWIVVIFNLILTLGLIRRVRQITNAPDFGNFPSLKIGTPAPDFHAETVEGQSVNLAEYAHQSTAFIFVSTECTPCIENIPFFHRIEPQAKRHDIKIVLVVLASKSETQIFVEKHQITLPVLIAPKDDNDFSEKYMAVGTPFFCLIDKDGKVEATGFLDDKWDRLVQVWSNA